MFTWPIVIVAVLYVPVALCWTPPSYGFFLVAGILTVVAHWLSGVSDSHTFYLGGNVIPGVVAGTLYGTWLYPHFTNSAYALLANALTL